MLKTLNATLAVLRDESVLETSALDRAFRNNWPDLRAKLDRIKNDPVCMDNREKDRPEINDMVAEMLVGIRDLQRVLIPESTPFATATVTSTVGADHPLSAESSASSKLRGDLTIDRASVTMVRITTTDQGFIKGQEQAEVTNLLAHFDSIDEFIRYRNNLTHLEEMTEEERAIFRMVSLTLERFLAQPPVNSTISNIKVLRKAGGNIELEYDEA